MAFVHGMLDRWREILETMWRRKLRTALTALSVAWGIFMLVVLLAAGNGLANGAEVEFSRDAMNSVWVNGWRMSRPFEGNPVGKWVRLYNEDHELARKTVPIIEVSSAVVGMDSRVRRGSQTAGFSLLGVLPEHDVMEKTDLVDGRFLNADDQSQRRKVAVIGAKVRDTLFPRDAQVVGQMIEIARIPFTVIGLFEAETEEWEQQTIYIPLSTAQLLLTWGPRGPNPQGQPRVIGNRLERFGFTVGNATAAQTNAAVEGLRAQLAARKGFSPDDKQALRMWNNQEVYERFRGLFRGIRTFVWLIGLGTILAGVVGVSNIMLISVQERTREIGVRKAVGAPPSSIIAMILQEAMAVTLVSGYLGLCAGVALVSFAQKVIPPSPFFRRPEVDLLVGLGATAVLVVAGMLAGLFPALRAARVSPIAALRVE
jgi:putative ABC transport system permease protein